MNRTSWFLLGTVISTVLKLPIIVGIGLGFFLASKFAQPRQQHEWHSTFQSFSVGAYHQHVFTSLGLMAKADGHISKKEIDYATRAMQQMGLNFHQIALAKQAFKQGANGANLAQVCNYMRMMHLANPNMVASFLAHLETISKIDGPQSRQQANIFEQIKFNIYQENQYHYQQSRQPLRSTGSLHQAYQVLGVKAQKPLKDIKRAYQKLLGKHHPDRFPEGKEKTQAEEKVKSLHSAWETIKRHHKETV